MSDVQKSCLAIGVIAGIFIFSAVASITWVSQIPLCFFRYLSGFDCPGCGLTRGFIALFHGDFSRAIQLNAAAPVIVLWLGIYLADHGYRLTYGSQPTWYSASGSKIISKLFLFLLFGQWIYKISFELYAKYHF